jgi:hypothetical protein
MSRRKILEHESPRHHHPVSTIDIGCSDRRIKGSRGLLGAHMDCEMAIPITIPGAIKDLVSPKDPRDRESLLEKIELFGDDIKTIRARMHNECKACGGCQNLDYYEAMLLEARKVLMERFPRVEIILVIIDFDGFYLVEEDEVFAEMVAS